MTNVENTLKELFPLKIKHLPSGDELIFKAMITVFEDQYTSEWNTENVFGRMDPIRNFKGTSRSITLGWDVVAADLTEAKANMDNCSTLLAMLYPSYEATGVSLNPKLVTENKEGQKKFQKNNAALIKAAPLFELKFANLIADAKTKEKGLIGSIEGLVYAPDLEQDFFSEGNDLFPQTIKLSFQFTVAHTHPLGWNSTGKAVTQRQPNFPYKTTQEDKKGPNSTGGQ